MLRITAGEHRGRRLKVPDVTATRPLVERAREGVMNHLHNLVQEATVLDVYAGSGILGFEALSRGAGRLIAVERHPRAVAQLKENARILGVKDRLQVLKLDAFQVPALLDQTSSAFSDPASAAHSGNSASRNNPEAPACGGTELPTPDLIFFDPPYADFRGGGQVREKVWKLFCDLAQRLAPEGCAVVHTPKGILTADECAVLPGIEQRDYGSTSLYWWHKPAVASTSDSASTSDPDPDLDSDPNPNPDLDSNPGSASTESTDF